MPLSKLATSAASRGAGGGPRRPPLPPLPPPLALLNDLKGPKRREEGVHAQLEKGTWLPPTAPLAPPGRQGAHQLSSPSSVPVGRCASCLATHPSESWFGLVWFGLVWFGLVWFGLVWFGLVWFGLGLVWVWFGFGLGLVWVWLGLVGFGWVWLGLVGFGWV